MKTKILSARGKSSFTNEQVKRLQTLEDVEFVEVPHLLSDEELIKTAKDARVLAFTRRATKDFHAGIIDSLPQLQGVCIYATGYEWIDRKELQRRNINFAYLPDYSAQTVAEHTLGMILTLTRRLHLSFDRVRNLVPEDTSLRGGELFHKTIGILGYGRIARKLIPLLQPFQPNLLVYDEKDPRDNRFKTVSARELFSKSDVLILLADKKRGQPPIVDTKELNLCRGAYLVNSARAELVNHSAVVEAIQEKRLAGYALDDFSPELQDAPVEPGRIFQTGHTAWYSDEALNRGTETWVNNILSLAGKLSTGLKSTAHEL